MCQPPSGTNADGVAGGQLGYLHSVSMDNADTIIAGAPGANGFQGAVYAFSGSAAAPAAPLSTSSLSFSGVAGLRTNAQSVTLTNSGNAPLQLTSVAVTGACSNASVCAFPFSSTKNCLAASPLAPGAQCTEQVTFVPASSGSFGAALVFSYDSGTGTVVQSVQLHGGATAGGLQRGGQLK